MHTKIKYLESLIISKFREINTQIYIFEKKRYNPESYEYSGITQAERAQRAKRQAEEAKEFSFEDVQNSSYYSLCLLAVARSLYLQAQDFCENPFIRIGNLKSVVILRNWHDLKFPNSRIYSTKHLINIK
jgi:hypothetical protein